MKIVQFISDVKDYSNTQLEAKSYKAGEKAELPEEVYSHFSQREVIVELEDKALKPKYKKKVVKKTTKKTTKGDK